MRSVGRERERGIFQAIILTHTLREMRGDLLPPIVGFFTHLHGECHIDLHIALLSVDNHFHIQPHGAINITTT